MAKIKNQRDKQKYIDTNKSRMLQAMHEKNYPDFLFLCTKLAKYNIDINTLSNKMLKDTFEEICQEKMLPKSLDVLGKNQAQHDYYYFEDWSIEKKLSQVLFRVSIILNEYKKEIESFIKNERIFFISLLQGDYNNCLVIIDKINKEISFSQWGLHMELTLLHLLEDNEKKQEKLNLIEKNYYPLNGKIFLHLHSLKLNMISSNTSNLETIIHNYKFHKNKRKQGFRKNDLEEYYNDINDNYLEKKTLSPFNTKSNYNDLKDQIIVALNHSVIDLYKSFASVITELQIDEDKYFKQYIYDQHPIVISKTIYLSYEANLIKLDNYVDSKLQLKRYLTYNKEDNNLFALYNMYLEGKFAEAITYSLVILEKYPYSMDAVYFLVHSFAFLENDTINNFLSSMDKKSLLYNIIINYYNLLIGKNVDDSITNLKKILLLFGTGSQWSMYLYHLIAKYLCMSTDKRSKSFTNATKYSYFNHPRLFYSFNQALQQKIVRELSKYKSISTVFLCNLNSQNNIDTVVSPTYRARYIQAKSNNDIETMLDLIKNLFDDKIASAPFFYKERIKLEYVQLLIANDEYEDAAKTIFRSIVNDNMPLCVYNYKNEEGLLLKHIKDTPYYPFFLILNQPDNSISIHYAMKEYLESLNESLKRVSILSEYISDTDSIQEAQISLLKIYNEEKYISENIPLLRNRKEVIDEQIKILKVIKKYDLEYDKDNIKEHILEKKLKTEKNRLFTDKHRLFLNNNGLKSSMREIFSIHVDEYKSAEVGGDKYLFYINLAKENNYESNDIYKEEKFEKILRLFIENEYSLISSNIGISNLINENIIHNHFDDTLIQTFIKHEVYAKEFSTNGSIGYDVGTWSKNKNVSSIIISFSKKLNELTVKIKEKIKSHGENGYFNFDYTNIFPEQEFFSFFNEINTLGLFKSKDQFLDIVYFKILKFVELELKRGKQVLINELKKEINILVEDVITKSNNKELTNAINAAHNELNVKTYDALLDWFTLSDNSIHDDFNLTEIIETLKDKNPEIEKLKISQSGELEIKGDFFIYILNIFYIILHNASKHGSKKILQIDISQDDNYCFISISNKYTKNIPKLKQEGGIKYLRDNLTKLHPSNILNINPKNNNYVIELKMHKDIFK